MRSAPGSTDMLSIELIRRDPEFVNSALESRGEEDPLAEILTMDVTRRQLITEGDELRARRNQVSRQVGEARRAGQQHMRRDDLVRGGGDLEVARKLRVLMHLCAAGGRCDLGGRALRCGNAER